MKLDLRCPACGDKLEVTSKQAAEPSTCTETQPHAHIGLKIKPHTCTFVAVVQNKAQADFFEQHGERRPVDDSPQA